MGHSQAIFSPDGTAILSVNNHASENSNKSTAQLWDVNTTVPLGSSIQLKGTILSVTFSPDGKTILTTSTDHGDVRLSYPATELDQVLINESRGHVGGRVRLWDAATGAPVGKPLDLQGSILKAVFSPDGRCTRVLEAVMPMGEGTTGRLRATFASPITSTVYPTLTVRMWDAFIGAVVGKPLLCSIGDRVLAISADGSKVLTGSDGKAARLWDVTTGRPVGSPLRHAGALTGAVIGPDCKTVFIRGTDGTARLWDTATGQPIGAVGTSNMALLRGVQP